MATLPAYYVDNVTIFKDRTIKAIGNKISDCYGANVKGIEIVNCNTLRMKDNSTVRLRQTGGTSTGIKIQDCVDLLMIYSVASRCDVGVELEAVAEANIQNITTHDCSTHVKSDSDVNIINASTSCYVGASVYQNSTGFVSTAGAVITLDYAYYFGLSALSSGTFSAGSTITEQQPLYIDEPNDSLTPDNISVLINTGTANSLYDVDVDIGGIESEITVEQTADRNYHRNLLDNTFWDVDNDQSVEVSFIKGFQSRILANSELALNSAKRDYYVKTMDATQGFAELFQAYSIYDTNSLFKKKIEDLWYATENVSTLQAMQNTIGSYNRFPTFFRRLEDYPDVWILSQSSIATDNTLLGYEGLKYGIQVDVLGISTLSSAASGECYQISSDCVEDLAPTPWFLNEYPQPSGYFLFADLWNSFEDCVLENMVYNDDNGIQTETVGASGSILTPLFSTLTTSASGWVEVSVLDRVYSENIERKIYWRQGSGTLSMSDWTELHTSVGSDPILLNENYVQFRIDVSGVLRTKDYEFVSLAFRLYESARSGWPFLLQ